MSDVTAPEMEGAERPKMIWEGVLEWVAGSQEHPAMSYDAEVNKWQVPVPCTVWTRKGGGSELDTASWPRKLTMRLITKQLLFNITSEPKEEYIKNCKSFLFHPEPCEALVGLAEAMGVVNVGYVQFPAESSCDVKVVVILYAPNRRAYLGFIPSDQTAFVQQLLQAVQHQKLSAPKRRKEDQLPYEELKQIVKSLRKTLKCVVCELALKKDTLTCKNGHCICKPCRGNQRECPTCRNNFSNVGQNTLVQQILDIVPRKCEHGDCSCLVRCGDDHETYCGYRLTECQICQDMMSVKDLLPHVQESHSAHFRRGTSGFFELIFPADHESMSINFRSVFGRFLWEKIDINWISGVLVFQYFPVNCGKPIEELYVKLAFQPRYEVQSQIMLKDRITDENRLLIPTSAIQWSGETTAPSSSNQTNGHKTCTLYYSFSTGVVIICNLPV